MSRSIEKRFGAPWQGTPKGSVIVLKLVLKLRLLQIASDWNKPDGQMCIGGDRAEVLRFLHDLPVRKVRHGRNTSAIAVRLRRVRWAICSTRSAYLCGSRTLVRFFRGTVPGCFNSSVIPPKAFSRYRSRRACLRPFLQQATVRIIASLKRRLFSFRRLLSSLFTRECVGVLIASEVRACIS